jgi:hypothetical protein
MNKPQQHSRSAAETDPANAGPEGRLERVNHTIKNLLYLGLDVHAQTSRSRLRKLAGSRGRWRAAEMDQP